MLLVGSDLRFTAAIGLADGPLHGVGYPIGVHDHASRLVACSAPDGLDQRSLGSEIALLVRVEDADQGDFGQVESLAEEVDTHHDVVHAEAQIAQDVYPL